MVQGNTYSVPNLSGEEAAWLCRVFRKIELFSNLTVADIGQVVDHMVKCPFPKGARVVKQGDKGDSFFIIHKGAVRVSHKKGLFSSSDLGMLGPEQFFGEMSLLHGDPRSATITAEQDTECFTLFKGDFEHLVKHNPAFAKLMQAVSDKRKFEMDHK